MLKPKRVLHFLRRHFDGWQSKRVLAKHRHLMEQSLSANETCLKSLRRELAPGQKLVAIMLIEHFGDIIACEPVIRHLRLAHPNDRLIWILRENYRELVAAHPQLDAVLGVTCLTEALNLAASQNIDRVVNLHVNLRCCPWFGTIYRRTSGDPAITVGNYYNYGSLLESFCRSAGLAPLLDQPYLYLPPQAATEVDALVPRGSYYVVHAVSNEAIRDWDSAKWSELFARMPAAAHATWVEVGLKAEVAGHVPKVMDLCGRLSLVQLAEVIRRSAGFIGVDSGPAHMANAFRRPSVVLLGRYRAFECYMPYTGYLRDHADKMLIRWDGSTSDISVNACLDRVRTVWPELFSTN